MKIRVRWAEHTVREAIIEAESIAEVEGNWEEGYGSGMVDEIEAQSTEVDGGIDWASATFEEVTR